MSFRSADLLRLINEHGKNLTYTSKSAATYNPVTGGTTGTNTTKTVKGYFYNYSASDITGTSIVIGSSPCYFHCGYLRRYSSCP